MSVKTVFKIIKAFKKRVSFHDVITVLNQRWTPNVYEMIWEVFHAHYMCMIYEAC